MEWQQPSGLSWQYGRPHGAVVFDFRMGRGREGPKHFLGNFDGLCKAMDMPFTIPWAGRRWSRVAVGRTRNEIRGAVKLHSSCRRFALSGSSIAVSIDAEARVANLDHAAATSCAAKRLPHCLRRSGPRLPQHVHVIARQRSGQSRELHAGALAKLTRFRNTRNLELSNTWARKLHAPGALGRKNWIHIGSEQAGPKVAAILSVVEPAGRMNIPVREYLPRSSPVSAETPIHRLPQLTPIAGLHKTANLLLSLSTMVLL